MKKPLWMGLAAALACGSAFAIMPEVRGFRAPVGTPKEVVKGFVWVEAEGFADYGQWRLDTQFVHRMGSGYLLAAGVLKPLGLAKTTVVIPAAGDWTVWARTKDWLPEYHPGTFRVQVNGRAGETLGRSGKDGWRWEKAGVWTLSAGPSELALEDLSGAFARCDALLLTTDAAYVPPDGDADCEAARAKFTGADMRVKDGGDYEFVVVGSGPGGISAAIAAARRGVRTALVHDRPVLGGNASCELGVPTDGAAISHPNAREGGICEEANLARVGTKERTFSAVFREMAKKLPTLAVFSNQRVTKVDKDGAKIAAVIARDTLTGGWTRFRGQIFLDGTGDGWIGYFAGAELLYGREGKDKYDEWPAPEKGDEMLMSGCLMGNYLGYLHRSAGRNVPFAVPEWAHVLPKGFTRWTRNGDSQWWVEHSGRFNEVTDPERARDELFRINLAYWGWLKNEWERKDTLADHELYEMAHMNGRREGYRILGDYILTGNDCLAGRMFDDRVSYGGWPLDRHDPEGMENPTGNGYCPQHPNVPIYSIPFRCLYSKNVPNLVMAGRNVSVSHVALGSVRVEATIMTLGQAMGTAAERMLKKGLLPREYGADTANIRELQQILLKDDLHIPGLVNEDPLDLARGAKATATSVQKMKVVSGESIVRHELSEHRHELNMPRATGFARGAADRLDGFSCWLESDAEAPVEVKAVVYAAKDQTGRAASMRRIGEASAVVKEGFRGFVAFAPSAPIPLEEDYVWVRLQPAKEISWRVMIRSSAAGAVRAYGGGDGWRTVGGERYACVPAGGFRETVDSRPEYVVDGVSRPVGSCTHGWISDPAAKLPQTLTLDFAKPTRIGEVRLTFDSDLNPLHPAPHPVTLARKYRIEGLEDGDWTVLAEESENLLRHRIHAFPAKDLRALRVTVLATWGDPSARIFEIRAYAPNASAAGRTADVVVGTGAGEARSFGEAVARVRTLRAKGELTGKTAVIAVRPGRHRMTKPVVLTPEDSHLSVVGENPETCVLDGGIELPPFKVGANGVWETEVPDGIEFEQLWIGDRRATRARTPNRYWFYMKEPCFDAPDSAFFANPKDVARLAALTKRELDRVLVSYWQSWDMGYTRIGSLDAKSGRLDILTKPYWPFFYWNRTCPRYALENYRAALDAPGEWFLDLDAGKLLYLPLPGETTKTARAFVPRTETLVRFEGDRKVGRVVSDVTFVGVGFEHTSLSMSPKGLTNFQAAMNVKGAALSGKGVENLAIRNCRVAHTASHGMMLRNGSRNVTVEHSLFEDLGAGAIGFSGTASPKDEPGINEGLTVRDSILRHGGRVVQGAIGVWIGHARDCLVEHNDVYDFYYTGISCGWTWGYAETVCRRNRIAFNRVHHIGQGVLSDMGAVYTLGDNGRSEVCNNWVSDVDGYKDNGSPTFGFYTDEGSRGFLFASNLVENCRYCALHQHYGRDNAFVNNICVGFEDCAVLRSRAEKHVTMALTNNVFWWRSPETAAYSGWGTFEQMTKDLPTAGNVYWCAGGTVTNTAFKGKDWAAWQAAGNDRGGAIADPLFADAAHGDWRLGAGSPALKAGFVPFDWKEAGVLKSDAGWTAKAAERTWDEFGELPRAPKFESRSYEFDGRNYLNNLKDRGKRPLFVYHNGRADGAFAQAPDGKGLRITDSKAETHLFAPHFKFWPAMAGRDLQLTFSFRPVSGDGMEFEVRDWDEERGPIKSGFRCAYREGKVVVNGRAVLAVPLGMWATVDLTLRPLAKERLAVTVTRADGVRESGSFERLLHDGFDRANWYGFMTYGDGTSVWDLGDLRIRALGQEGKAADPRPQSARVAVSLSDGRCRTNDVELARLADGTLRLRMSATGVPANAVRMDVAFGPMSARKGEDGFWVLSDGRYGTFRCDEGKCDHENAQRRKLMPICGMKTPRGAFLEIVRGLAHACDFKVEAHHGVYSMSTTFRLDALGGRPPYEDIVVDFIPLPESEATYAGMARRYRNDRLAKGEVRPISERVKEHPTLAYTAESIFVRVKHGWKALNTERDFIKAHEWQTPTNEPPVKVSISFDRYMDIMRRMKAAGIGKAEMCSVGGTAGGFDGRFPDVLPLPEEFGGIGKFREAVRLGQSLGYQMVAHFAVTAMLPSSRQFDPDDICRNPDGSLLFGGIVAGGRTHRLCPRAFCDRMLVRDWEEFRSLGLKGTHHIDVVSCIPPYACFNPRHPLDFEESAECFRRIGEYSRKVFGGFGSESGFDWMAPALDFALYVSWFPGGRGCEDSPIVDRIVPFWQLVYHGIIVSNPFYATIDAYIDRSKERLNFSDEFARYGYLDNAETRILKLHEFGGRPVFYYTEYNDVTPLKRAADDYARYSHLQYAFMDDHRELARDVFLTRYSTGAETVTNYARRPFSWKGQVVGPRSIRLFEKGVESL